MKPAKGKFIVIDGTDGSGKATQVSLLTKRLKKKGQKIKQIDFPQYKNNFFGKLIGQCLAGDYGDFIGLDPHLATVLYAADRYESSAKIKKWLEEGYLVIADRYVSSNQIHQGSKISADKERLVFLKWLDKMEHSVFKIPRPDLIIYLDVPIAVTTKLLANKEQELKKVYLKGKKDQAENDKNHLQKSRENAIKLVKKLNKWIKIDCTDGENILSREKINDLIWDKVERLIAKK